MIEEIKRRLKKDYDCILGLSGVSMVLIQQLKFLNGTKTIVLHIDAGWNSELAVKNIEQICKILNFDLVTHVVDWEIMKDLQLSFLKSGIANQDVPQDHAFFADYIIMPLIRIKNVMNGGNISLKVYFK